MPVERPGWEEPWYARGPRKKAVGACRTGVQPRIAGCNFKAREARYPFGIPKDDRTRPWIGKNLSHFSTSDNRNVCVFNL